MAAVNRANYTPEISTANHYPVLVDVNPTGASSGVLQGLTPPNQVVAPGAAPASAGAKWNTGFEVAG